MQAASLMVLMYTTTVAKQHLLMPDDLSTDLVSSALISWFSTKPLSMGSTHKISWFSSHQPNHLACGSTHKK